MNKFPYIFYCKKVDLSNRSNSAAKLDAENAKLDEQWSHISFTPSLRNLTIF